MSPRQASGYVDPRLTLVTLGVADLDRSIAFYREADYFTDPDGHPWEVAWNPFWPMRDDGRIYLPAG